MPDELTMSREQLRRFAIFVSQQATATCEREEGFSHGGADWSINHAAIADSAIEQHFEPASARRGRG